MSKERAQEDAILEKLYKFANESPNRVPLSDFYDAATGRVVAFQARPVMGGIFVRALLENPLIEVTTTSESARRRKLRHGRESKCSTS
jgi:hypothetical protein